MRSQLFHRISNEICTVFVNWATYCFSEVFAVEFAFPDMSIHQQCVHKFMPKKFCCFESLRSKNMLKFKDQWRRSVSETTQCFWRTCFFQFRNRYEIGNQSFDRSIDLSNLSIYLSICLSVYLSTYLSIYPSIFNLYMSLHLSLDLHVFKPVYLDLPIFSIRSSSASTVDHPRS